MGTPQGTPIVQEYPKNSTLKGCNKIREAVWPGLSGNKWHNITGMGGTTASGIGTKSMGCLV